MENTSEPIEPTRRTQSLADHLRSLGEPLARRDLIDLFVISFLSLYLEILLIRWLAANVRLLAYFTNITLFEPVIAYSVNVVGSILGVLAFALFSFVGASSVVWFVVLFVVALALRPPNRLFRPLLVVIAAGSVAVVVALDPPSTIWSPYHKITLEDVVQVSGQREVSVGHQLFINRDFYQFMLDLSASSPLPPDDPYIRMWRTIYDAPYHLGQPRDVLVIGAGSGNDVAAALRAGVEHVDAVDIDREIIAAGRALHPEHPYDDSRVTVTCQDARQFLRRPGRRYDLIVMGYLDSQTLFSRMSNVRLDSFIYTTEAFRQMYARLKPGGTLVCYFAAPEPWIVSRLYDLIVAAFGHEPTVYRGAVDVLTLLAVSRDGSALPDWHAGGVVKLQNLRADLETVPVTTDDWPFLYVKERGIPTDYLKTLAILLVLSLVLLAPVVPRKGSRAASMFFLGAGFLLLETLTITRLSLLYGATWTVSSAVIVGFLVAILVANIVVLTGWRIRLAWVYAVLLAAIAANALIPVAVFLRAPTVVRVVLSTTLYCLPVFCAGLIFATEFRNSRDPRLAFGANTMGAVVGGFLEYATLAIGFQGLYWVVALVYVLSWPRWRLGASR